MLCWCMVYLWFISIPITAATSRVIYEMNWVSMLVIIVNDGKYVCLHSLSIMILAIAGTANGVVGYANRYREKTIIAVIMLSKPLLGERVNRMSIWSTSYGPKSNSGHLRSSVYSRSLLIFCFFNKTLGSLVSNFWCVLRKLGESSY